MNRLMLVVLEFSLYLILKRTHQSSKSYSVLELQTYKNVIQRMESQHGNCVDPLSIMNHMIVCFLHSCSLLIQKKQKHISNKNLWKILRIRALPMIVVCLLEWNVQCFIKTLVITLQRRGYQWCKSMNIGPVTVKKSTFQ